MRGAMLLGGAVGRRAASTAVAAAGRTTSDAVAALPATFITQLDSGLRVASQRTAHRTGTVGLYVEAGPRFETLPHYGCSNMLQHLALRPHAAAAAKAGVRLGVDADREIVTFNARCLDSELEAAAALLGSAVSAPAISDADVDAEKDLVFRQIQARDTKYKDFTFDILHRTAFQGTPLEQNMFGYSDAVRGMTAHDVKDFHRNYVIAPRAVVVGVGPWDHGDLVRLVQKHFAGLHAKPAHQAAYEGPCRFSSAMMKYRDDSYPACFMAVGLEGLPYGHPDSHFLRIVGALAGSFDRSKDPLGSSVLQHQDYLHLAQNNRISHRVYEFDFFNRQYKDSGLFGGYWVLDEFDYLPDACLRNFLKRHLVRLGYSATATETELGVELAKTRLVAENAGQASDVAAFAIGQEILYTGDRKPLAEKLAAFDGLSDADLRRFADGLIVDKTVALAGVGLTECMPTGIDGISHGPNMWMY